MGQRARHLLTLILASFALAGCGAVIDSVLDNPDSCRDTCEQTYQACLEQMGTPDANHYCLNRRTQCFADC